MARIIVVGAGVLGLTCALRLLEDGHRVDVLARDLPLETTSSVAAAIWYPYRALPQDRVTSWAGAAYAEFVGLSGEPDSGVRMVTGTEVFTERRPDPWWRTAVPSLDRETALPPGYVDGWTFTTPVIEMPRYLRWLHARVETLGGTITRMNLQVLPAGGDLVINCAGLGSRHLAQDKTVVPVRGEVLTVRQPAVRRWTLDEAGPTYVVPRAHDVVVGGTTEEGEWSRTPSVETARLILARATQMVPQLEGAQVLSHRVGLRPVRPAVRVERVGRIIHCYGHGGAGVTMSWGCAEDVVVLASD